MQMQQQQPQPPNGGGGMMPSYLQSQGQGMIPPPQQMGYNHNHNPQMQQQQQLSGFNQKQQVVGHPSQPPPNYPTNSSYGAPIKPNVMGGQQQQQQQQQQHMFPQGMKPPQQQQQQIPLTNDINIDQMLNNITDDPSAFSGDTAELFHSLDSNYSSILDNL